MLRYLTKDELRLLTAVEMGMKNHELVQKALIVSIAQVKSGVSKALMDLCRKRLLQYESSGCRYSGYRLTNAGYDYLALKALVGRDVMASFGNQIGTGKESNIYVVGDKDGETLCLKLHRLGRTCFRKGNIHILRKHLSSTKFILTSKFFSKTGFFYQNKRSSFSTLHFDEVFMLKLEIFTS
jgi:RIO kinase 2